MKIVLEILQICLMADPRSNEIPNSLVVLSFTFNSKRNLFCIYFGGLECVGHFFAYVALL
jgi:hypothetical protein